MFQIEREANVIAKETRRGKGNFILCSADVASNTLAMSGMLSSSPAFSNTGVDDTGNHDGRNHRSWTQGVHRSIRWYRSLKHC